MSGKALMQETGKHLPTDRNRRPVETPIAVGPDQAIDEGCSPASSLTASPTNIWFARGLARLFQCNRCYVGVLSPNEELIDEVRTGCPILERVSSATVYQLATQLGAQHGCIHQSAASAYGFARRLIGSDSAPNRHCVIGRMPSYNGSVAVFVGGWRRAPLTTAESANVTHAINLMWNAAADLAEVRVQQSHLWLDDIVHPAIVVDKNLAVRNMNAAFQQLLDNRAMLGIENGVLAGSSRSITARLKEAVQRTFSTEPHQKTHESTVLLTNDDQTFSFAIVGTLPGDGNTGLALIAVPQFDVGIGAGRIAAAFNLSWVEERIVICILLGRCPRDIGTELGFTDETVRTYIKRIMIKIGINRQSEFFVLHSLTSSPFRSGQHSHNVVASSALGQVRENSQRRKVS